MATDGAERLRRGRRRAAATTASSPRRTSPGPACARSSSSGARRVGGAATRRSSRPASACPTLAHTVGRLRPSVVARPRPQAPRAVARRARRPGLRAAAGRRGDHALGRRGADRRGPAHAARPPTRTRYVAFDRLVRSLGRVPRRARRPTPPDIESPGLGRRAGRAASSGRTFRGLGRPTAGRSCASCRWPSPTSWPSRSRPTRCGPRSPGAASSTPRWARGRPAPTAVLLGDSAGNDGGAAGQTVFARGGPGALAEALARRRARPAPRSGPAPRSSRSRSRDGRATGVVLAAARRSRPARSSPASTRSGR